MEFLILAFIVITGYIVIKNNANKTSARTNYHTSRLSPKKNQKKSLQIKNPLPEDFEETQEFKNFFNVLENGDDNIFLTGRAGVGKTTFLEYFKRHTLKNYIVLAPTGVSAIRAGGQTIHSFFSFPPRFLIDSDYKHLNRQKKEILRKLDLIFIDECSMVSANLLDAIDKTLKINMGNEIAFGGIKIILIGDLFQLPPIVSGEQRLVFNNEYPQGRYFFNSHILKNTNIKKLELTTVFRQKDPYFIDLLNKIRIGTISQDEIDSLNNQVTTNPEIQNDKDIIILSTTNVRVDSLNEKNLNRLPDREYQYSAWIDGPFYTNEIPAEQNLILKVGAKVMMLANDLAKNGSRWVNGSMGIIHELSDNWISVNLQGKIYSVERHTWSKYSYEVVGGKVTPKVIATFTQYPFKLAWAATIHKSQGQTFSKTLIDFDNGTFDHGQAYVGLSRCTDLEGLFLFRPLYKSDIIFDKKIIEWWPIEDPNL